MEPHPPRSGVPCPKGTTKDMKQHEGTFGASAGLPSSCSFVLFVVESPVRKASRIRGPLHRGAVQHFAKNVPPCCTRRAIGPRSEEHTSELQSLMRISYAVFCLKKKNNHKINIHTGHKMLVNQVSDK